MSHNFSHNLAEIARSGGFLLCDENSDGNDIRVDWRFIAAIDIHRIVKESNFEKLDECIPFLIKTSLSNLLNTRILDPAIAKIYSLSQLSLQYLLFCTKFLDKSVNSLRENLYILQKQNLELQDTLKERDKELHLLRKRVRRQDQLKSPLEIFPCTKCTKNFESQLLLDSHMLRRHRESKDQDSNLINTIKLELEIKQLKEKLNLTEKELMDAKIVECPKCLQNEMRIFRNVGIQINSEEKEKDDTEKEDRAERLKEFDDTIRKLMADQMMEFQNYKKIDEKRHQQEISDLRDMLDKAVDALKQQEMKPLPAPRHTIGVQASNVPGHNIGIQASDDSSISSISEAKIEQKLEENENLWKTRFKELEKMYEHNQTQMSQSMKDMERAYAEKMVKLEVTVNQLKNQKVVANSVIPVKEIVPRVHIKEAKASSTSCSSDDEVIEDVKPLKAIKEVQPAKPQEPPKEIKNFSGQKFVVRDNKTKKSFSAQKWSFWNHRKEHEPPKDDQKANREKAEKLFKDRMKEFNVDKHMNTSKFDEVQSELANRRDLQKKKHPHFFIKRKKIKAKVDELFKNRVEKKQQNDEVVQPQIAEQHDEKPKKKVLFNLTESQKPVIKSNEDSDFDITSLEDDLK